MSKWKLYLAGVALVIIGAVTNAPLMITQGMTTLATQAAADAAAIGGAQ